jgi:hypothetical protein
MFPDDLSHSKVNDLFKDFNKILPRKPNKKIIFITKENSVLAELLKEKLPNESMKIDDKFTWSDLTLGSQEKLLKTTVNFQGSKIALNQLISAASRITKFLAISDLIKENQLETGKPLPVSNGNDDGYYIGRIFNHQMAIKQDFVNDEREGKFSDLLAKTEEKFTQLCRASPNKNVQWLLEDTSGRLFWKLSQEV